MNTEPGSQSCPERNWCGTKDKPVKIGAAPNTYRCQTCGCVFRWYSQSEWEVLVSGKYNPASPVRKGQDKCL